MFDGDVLTHFGGSGILNEWVQVDLGSTIQVRFFNTTIIYCNTYFFYISEHFRCSRDQEEDPTGKSD